METNGLELSNSNMLTAIEGYAQGKPSGQIIDELIEELGVEDTPDVRESLRNQLRATNPNDKRFAVSKYGVPYEMARQAAVDVLRERARDFYDNVMGSLAEGLDNLDVIEASLNDLIDKASDNSITSNTEYLNTIKILVGLQKVRIEGVNAVAAMVDAMTKALPHASPSDETSD